MHLYRLETIGSLDGLGALEEAIAVPAAGEVWIRARVITSDAAGEMEAVGP
jgi:hypothetical protein